MAEIKDIITIENENKRAILEQHCVEIDTVKEAPLMRQIISELKKTMKRNNLFSLSAPAIGYDKRIFCVDFKDSEIKTFINPILTQVKGLSLSKESCTSIPGKQFIRPRNTDLTIIYQRPLGQIETRQVTGMAAFVIQHEIDHLDGLLLSDIGLEVDSDFDNATEEEREEIINMYLDSLDLKQKNLQKIIEDDPEAKEISDGIRFMEGVAKGEILTE